jgi:hypothetical protein
MKLLNVGLPASVLRPVIRHDRGPQYPFLPDIPGTALGSRSRATQALASQLYSTHASTLPRGVNDTTAPIRSMPSPTCRDR